MEYLRVQLAIFILNLLILLSFIILILIARFYFPSYMKEKAKNLATKEDVALITEEMEKVKTEYAKSLEVYKGEIWQEQQKLLWFQEECKLKIDIFKKSVVIVNKFNDKIVNHQIYSSSRDMALAFSEMKQSLDQSARDYYRSEYESFRIKAEASFLDFRAISTELSELSALLAIYFDPSLHELALEIRDKGNLAMKSQFTPIQIAEKINEVFAQNHDLNVTKTLVGAIYDKTYEALIPNREAQSFLEKIRNAAASARACG